MNNNEFNEFEGEINESPNTDYVDSKQIPNDQDACANVTNDSMEVGNIDRARPLEKMDYDTAEKVYDSKQIDDTIPQVDEGSDHDDEGNINVMESPNDDYVDSKHIPNDQDACANVTNDSMMPGNIDKVAPLKDEELEADHQEENYDQKTVDAMNRTTDYNDFEEK